MVCEQTHAIYGRLFCFSLLSLFQERDGKRGEKDEKGDRSLRDEGKSEEEGGMKVAKGRAVMEEEDTTVPVEERREKGVKAVAEGRGEMETALLMMAARTVQRLLVGEAEERRASELGRRTRRKASPTVK